MLHFVCSFGQSGFLLKIILLLNGFEVKFLILVWFWIILRSSFCSFGNRSSNLKLFYFVMVLNGVLNSMMT